MKIKILGRINLWDIILIILVSLFCWILLHAIFPHYPKNLTNLYNLCDTPLVITPKIKTNHVTFSCKTKIPIDILFFAKAIYVDVFSNQEASMAVFLRRNGSGGMQPSFKRIFPQSTSGNLVAYDLESTDNPKINWLTGNYDEVIFEIDNFKSLDNIELSIQKIYLK